MRFLSTARPKLMLCLAEGFDNGADLDLEERFKLAWNNLCRFAHENPEDFYFLEMQNTAST